MEVGKQNRRTEDMEEDRSRVDKNKRRKEEERKEKGRVEARKLRKKEGREGGFSVFLYRINLLPSGYTPYFVTIHRVNICMF